MQEQVNAINHNISSVSFHSIYKSWTLSWLEWFFSKSGDASEALCSSEANFPWYTFSFSVFPRSLHLTSSPSLSQLVNPSQLNLNLFPTNCHKLFPQIMFFFFSLTPFLLPCLFLHPSLADTCYFFLLNLVWSLANSAFDRFLKKQKKNATFTFHRLFKLASAVCVWYP